MTRAKRPHVEATLVTTRKHGTGTFLCRVDGPPVPAERRDMGFYVRRERGSRCSVCSEPSPTLIACAPCSPLVVGEPSLGTRVWWGVCLDCLDALVETAEEVPRW